MSNQKKCFDQVLIETRKVNKVFGSGKKSVHAVKDMDFLLHKGEIVSIVGQSGSGKTTLAKILLGLLKETNGEIIYDGKRRDLSSLQKRRAYWQNIQAIPGPFLYIQPVFPRGKNPQRLPEPPGAGASVHRRKTGQDA